MNTTATTRRTYDEQAGAKERGVEGDAPQLPRRRGSPPRLPSFGNGGGTFLNPCCNLGEQWKLFDCECLKCREINVAGWLAQSYTWNTTNPADRFNGPVTWTDRSNDYQLNQAVHLRREDHRHQGLRLGLRLAR